MQDFPGKTAVITGGASGIGLAMGEAFAAEGMNIVLADIEAQPLQQAVTRLQQQGANCIGVVTDVAEAEAVQALADRAVAQFGAIHVACNNAGVFTGGLLWEESLADYRWVLDVNLWGVIHGIRSFLPVMQAQNCECHMVNTASMAALTAMPYSGIYHMSKHAVLALSESLYHELAFHSPQVKLSVLCPEAINTGIARAERNRPRRYSDAGDVVSSDARDLVMESLAASVAGGLGPEIMAQRVLQAIRNEQFYILSEEAWRESANLRLDDIREGRNPTFAPPL
ncbi:SDR family NAD(P)-dependent oxidoreductase [Seongchinamella unica]|uniref:SDR family NAD(P)-dependent oxidoreductase n=1 Tax=Seongchinamella unica TaxID=2547392 RepID=A0A4R5LRC6_9GAMM|nr:SDR family NAD(P)-dependent oxidoreductase [Seongchinamella unica]TDG13428.1 SDR family NAD(P)-dependent oxidoreductase [Seongchinamella unica]